MLQIRGAEMGDCEGLARVQVDSYRTAYAGILSESYLAHFTYEEQTQDWLDRLAAPTSDILLVALDESNEVVGYALARPGPADITPYESELIALHLRQDRQGRGIGTRLVAEISQRLHDRGCRSLMVWVLERNPARRFYEKLGGQLIANRSLELDEGMTVTEVAYGWPDVVRPCKRERQP